MHSTKYASPSTYLGNALLGLGKLDESTAELREAMRLQPDSPQAAYGLGSVLMARGDAVGAIAAYRQAMRLGPDLAEVRVNLAAALLARGDGDVAAAEVLLREAARLKPDLVEARYNLGNVLSMQGKGEDAIAAYREAIRLKPDHAEAHCNLGLRLRERGKFADALSALREGHRLGSRRADWPYPSSAWIRECEGLAALEERLPGVLRGADAPRDNAERVAFGQVAVGSGRLAAAAKLWGEALDADPKLAEGAAGLRYNAACAAASAGVGQGADEPKPDDAAKATLRAKARSWLSAELLAWERSTSTAGVGDRDRTAKALAHWKADADLAGVRDPDALAKLPEPEREEWKAFWARADALLARVRPVD